MATKIKICAVAAIIFATTIFSKCKKISLLGCTESSYSFNVDAKVYPDKDSINIGDTIWVEINSPTTFTDQFNTPVDYSQANNLGTVMGFVKVINISPIQLENVVKDFSFLLIAGKEIQSLDTALIKEYLFQESGGRYLFKLGIIPKVSGTFSFNLGNAANVIRKGNSCPKAAFSFLLKNTTNQHYYLYPGGRGVTPAGADYYFYVR